MDTRFDFPIFVSKLAGLSYREIVHLVKQKHAEIRPLSEMRSRQRSDNGEEIRNRASVMRGHMAAMTVLLGEHIKPGGMPDEEFLLLEPMCNELVAKGELPATILDWFKNAWKVR